MNPIFLPNEEEEDLIKIIHKYNRNEFALIRMTETMMKKSIIDASYEIREILKLYGIIDYKNIEKGQKEIRDAVVLLEDGELIKKVSYYRPETKNGDPRFWIYRLKSYIREGKLLYLTVLDNKLLAILLNGKSQDFEAIIKRKFMLSLDEKDENVFTELISKIKDIKNSGWILSVSPHKRNSKDMGETFEKVLGIAPNNLITPDYKGKIEIKTKDSKVNTKDTLFNCVPNWGKSKIKSFGEIALKYGYPTRKPEKYPEFIDLYVTVSNKPNNQGLVLEVNEEDEVLEQFYKNEIMIEEICKWDFQLLRTKLLEKHPKTAWIIGESTEINGEIHFRYTALQISKEPIFTEFLMLIENGRIVYDWRGRVRSDGTKPKDKGHAFRIEPRYKKELFGEIKRIEI